MQISEPAREVDVIHQTDVLVIGSGPGGLAAAPGQKRQAQDRDRVVGVVYSTRTSASGRKFCQANQ